MKYLIDTNILIYYFHGRCTPKEKKFIKNLFNISFNISIITKMEFLGWKLHTDETFKKAIDFLNAAVVFAITDSTVEKVIDLKRKYNIKLPDAIIASQAFENRLTLVTRNKNDFSSIIDMDFINPFEIE